jgi:hypothetical protein
MVLFESDLVKRLNLNLKNKPKTQINLWQKVYQL